MAKQAKKWCVKVERQMRQTTFLYPWATNASDAVAAACRAAKAGDSTGWTDEYVTSAPAPCGDHYVEVIEPDAGERTSR